jgi:hypothetical protein
VSGSIFGPVAQVQVPDFQATQARALQLAQARQGMQQQNALTQFFAQNGQGFASSDPTKRMNLLAMLAAQGGQGAAMALPMLGQERENQQIAQAFGGAPAAPQASPAAAPQTGMATPAAMPAAGGAAPPGDPSLPRGIRNNNPLNLSYVPGQPGVQGTDGRFGRYGSMEDGVAASVRQLQMYGQRGLNTVEQIIGTWAPPSENNTGAYVQRVAQALGVAPNAPVNLQDPDTVARMVAVMAQHENGRPVPVDAVQRGVQQALGGGARQAGGDTIPAQAAAPGATPGAAPEAGGNRYAPVIERLLQIGSPRAMQMAQTLSQVGARETPRMTEVRTAEGIFMVDPTNPNRRVRVGDVPEGAPLSERRFEQQRELAREGAARSNTTVNSGDRRTDVLIADAWKASEDTAVAAGRRAALLGRAEQAFDRFQPGILAERRIWLGQVARELGIRSPATAEGEVLQQVQRQLELATTPSGQGAITENERGLIRQAIPVLLSTPEGARQAIQMIRRLDDYEMQIARIYRQNARQNGGQPNAVSVREQIADFISQNQPPDVQAVIDNLSGPAPPAGVQADPPPGVPAPPRGFRIVQ